MNSSMLIYTLRTNVYWQQNVEITQKMAKISTKLTDNFFVLSFLF